MELTVCFEDNFDHARACKEAKYADLVDEIKENSFMKTHKVYLLLSIPNLRGNYPTACSGKPKPSKRQSHLVTVEVGARGFVWYIVNNLLGASKKDLLNFLVEVTKVSIKISFHLWTLRNCWSDHSEAIVTVSV